MIYSCSQLNVQFWIKLQQVQTKSYPSIERLKRTLEQDDNQNHQQQNQNLININPQSSSYISPIFSLQKLPKSKNNSHTQKIKRLLYHNYAKYKTIPFSYNKLYLPKEYSSSLVQDLSESIYHNAVQNRRNLCFLSFGSKQAETQLLIQGNQGSTEGVYYSALIRVIDMIKSLNNSTKFNESESISYTINFLAISQNKIIDLLNINNEIYVTQDPTSSFSKPLIFDNATECSFTSNYELYTTFKRVFFRKKQLNLWSVFVVKLNVYASQNQRNKKEVSNALLIQWVKQNQNFMTIANERSNQRNKSSFGQKSLLCLNQCILQIYKIIQARKQQKQFSLKLNLEQSTSLYSQVEIQQLSGLQCFRNSLITRILKPYLLFNSQFAIMTVCSINEEQQNDSYQSLMLGKHLSKLQSLSILKTISPTVREKQAQIFPSLEENMEDNYVQDYVPSNYENILQPKSPKQPKSQSQNKNSTYFHQSLSSSPKKKLSSVNENRSQHQLSSIKPLKKQQKIRSKLLNLLQESKSKHQLQNTEKNQFNQISKKMFEEKSKSLKTKKQLNMLKIKANTKNLRAKLTQKTESEVQMIQQQIKRLNFDQKKLQKEVSSLKETVQQKIIKVNQQNKQQNSSPNKQRAKIEKIRLLKLHLKNQLKMTEMEIDEFLEQKESIKSIYMNQIILLTNQQKELIKKLQSERNKFRLQQLPYEKSRKSLPKVRLTKEMQPFYKNSLANKVKVNLSLNRDNIGSAFFTEISPQKKLSKRYKSESLQQNGLVKSCTRQKTQNSNSLGTMEIDKLKKQRILIRKRSELKQKISRGKVDYIKFLQDTTKKYLDYSPQRRQSAK